MTEKIAVISDVHGNYWALKAVLNEIRTTGAADIINLGDSLYGPLLPLETAHLIMAENMISVAGNEDRLILEAITGPAHNSTIQENLESLDHCSIAWLQSLPRTRIWKDFFLFHGSPGDDCAYFCETVSGGTVSLKPEKELSDMTKDLPGEIILCGHSHMPRLITLEKNRVIINPGSVGLPAYYDDIPCFHKMETGNSLAVFCILTFNDNHLELIEHKHVVYDNSSAIEAAKSGKRPDWVKWLASGRS